MDRRELLLGAVAMATLATAGKAFADEHMDMKMDHDHMDMGMMHDHHSNRNEKLIAVAADCAVKANICVQHCILAMGKGEKDLAACAQSSSQVEALCTALEKMAAGESKHLPQLAKLAMDVCKDCEDECKKTDKHPECKACGEACAACYKECKAIAA